MLLCVSTQSCLTVCGPMDSSLPGFSVPWDSPGKNTGVVCHFILQGTFPTQLLNPHLLHLSRWQAVSLQQVPLWVGIIIVVLTVLYYFYTDIYSKELTFIRKKFCLCVSVFVFEKLTYVDAICMNTWRIFPLNERLAIRRFSVTHVPFKVLFENIKSV